METDKWRGFFRVKSADEKLDHPEIAECLLKLPEPDRSLVKHNLRAFIDRAKWPATTSQVDYVRAAEMMKREGRTLAEYADVRPSFDKMKSSVVWYEKFKLFRAFDHLFFVVDNNRPFSTQVVDLAKTKFVEAEREFLGQWALLETQKRSVLANHCSPKKKSKSKRMSLPHLPKDWVEKYWSYIFISKKRRTPSSDNLLDYVAILSLVGPRPREFLKNQREEDKKVIEKIKADVCNIRLGDGILVELKNNDLVFTIPGCKVRLETGQIWREIKVAVEGARAVYLRNRIQESGSLLIGIKEYWKLSRWLRQLSKTCFPELENSDHVTAYTFRHFLSSQMKAAGENPATIAATLGQQADRTQEVYGRARLARGREHRRHILEVRAATEIRNTKRMGFSDLRGNRLGVEQKCEHDRQLEKLDRL